MVNIQYEDCEFKIKKSLSNIKLQDAGINEPISDPLEGFIRLPLRDKICEKIILGGPEVPCVGVVGKETGQIYLFALKALIDI